MPSIGYATLSIIPTTLGVREALASQVLPATAAIGAEGGANLGSAITRGLADGVAAAQTQLRAATAAVQQSSVAISSARDKEAAAADRVQIAEVKLAEVRAKSAADSSAVVAAEARLEAAKRTQVTATDRVALAQANEGRAKEELIARNTALSASEERTAAVSGAGAEASAAKFSKLALGVSAAAVVMGVDGVKQAGDYQQSLTKLATTAGESTGNLKMVGDGMLTMAGTVGVSAQDLAKAMYVVESSGMHGADALLVMKSAAQGAKQENADLGHVTDAVTTALHDYNLPATDAAKVTSQLITAVSHGKTTFDELTGAMHSVTPVAAAAGISLADAAGTLASMTASGMSADQAAQNLGSTIKGLAAPTQPVIKEMAALGLSSIDLSKNLGKTGVAGTLQEVSTAILEKMGPAGTTLLNTMNQSKLAGADAAKMFDSLPGPARKVAEAVENGSLSFKEYRKTGGALSVPMKALADQWLVQYKNANGFSAALKSGGNDTQTYMEALKRATGTTDGMAVALQVTGEHAGATNAAIKDIAAASAQADGSIKGWDEVQGNFNQKLSEVVAGIKSWVIELGQKLLPAATSFMSVLMETGHWLGAHSALMKDVGIVVLGVVGALVLYNTTIKTVELTTRAWGAATALWTGITTTAKIATQGWTVATQALNVAQRANVIGVIVTVLAAVVVGLIYAYNHFEAFRNIVDTAGRVVQTVAGWIWEHGLKPAFEGVRLASIFRAALVVA